MTTVRTLRYEFILRAEEAICHLAESIGNQGILMRRKMRMADGSFANIPIVTAETMRHGLREAFANATIRGAGITPLEGLTEAALRLLFAGGMITGKGDAGAVKLDDYRHMVDLLPGLRLLGGCAGNRSIPGTLTVCDATLVCEETVGTLPTWVSAWLDEHKAGVATAREHVEEVQRVRMDPILDPNKRRLLAGGDKAAAEQRLLASEGAATPTAREESKSTMMPRRFETVVCGSLFFWRIAAVVHDDLTRSTLHAMLEEFLSEARVGGKRATGHGLVRVVAARNVTTTDETETAAPGLAVQSPGRVEGELALQVGRRGRSAESETFAAHIAARATQIRTFLREVDA